MLTMGTGLYKKKKSVFLKIIHWLLIMCLHVLTFSVLQINWSGQDFMKGSGKRSTFIQGPHLH